MQIDNPYTAAILRASEYHYANSTSQFINFLDLKRSRSPVGTSERALYCSQANLRTCQGAIWARANVISNAGLLIILPCLYSIN